MKKTSLLSWILHQKREKNNIFDNQLGVKIAEFHFNWIKRTFYFCKCNELTFFSKL
jgi:hypothetical protein